MRGLYRVRKTIKQSNLLIISENLQAVDVAIDSVVFHRSCLENYIFHHPEYRYSLSPVKVEGYAARIVKLASFAAEIAGVGPMAAIPGALAEIAVGDMHNTGSLVNLVENGGEIAAISHQTLKVCIYAGTCFLSGRIGFLLSPDDFPIGVATSSATVSHALNFGQADAAVVISDSASIADAAAKAVCNAVSGSDAEASVQSGLEVAETIPYVRSVLIIRGKYVGKVGKLPQLLKYDGNIDDVFKASLHEILPQKAVIL